MSRVRNRLGRSLSVVALALVVVYAGGPAYADDGPTFGGSPDGPKLGHDRRLADDDEHHAGHPRELREPGEQRKQRGQRRFHRLD